MEFIPTRFKGAWCIKPKVFGDHRGFFLETYSQAVFAQHGITDAFVQDNYSLSREVGVLRGLHFQKPDATQSKLVRVAAGEVWDVIVDLRKGSPTFGQWEGFTLSGDNFTMLYVPRGFAHGFVTTKPDTVFIYKVDNLYTPQLDSGIRWDDPTLAITWPVTTPLLSEKDKKLPLWHEAESPFTYS